MGEFSGGVAFAAFAFLPRKVHFAFRLFAVDAATVWADNADNVLRRGYLDGISHD